MGKEIVYCGACGTILLERDFDRGLAHTVQHRHFCARCRPLSTPTLPVHGTRTGAFVVLGHARRQTRTA